MVTFVVKFQKKPAVWGNVENTEIRGVPVPALGYPAGFCDLIRGQIWGQTAPKKLEFNGFLKGFSQIRKICEKGLRQKQFFLQ